VGNGDVSSNCCVGAVACGGSGGMWFGVEGDVKRAGGDVVGGEEREFRLDG
jgi:hypothetical protein